MWSELFCVTLTFPFQVYAPISGQDRSFHRTLFLFCCKTPECYTCNDSCCMKGNYYCGFHICHLSCSLFEERRRDSSFKILSLVSALALLDSVPSPHPLTGCLFFLSPQFSEVSYQGEMSSTPTSPHQVCVFCWDVCHAITLSHLKRSIST